MVEGGDEGLNCGESARVSPDPLEGSGSLSAERAGRGPSPWPLTEVPQGVLHSSRTTGISSHGEKPGEKWRLEEGVQGRAGLGEQRGEEEVRREWQGGLGAGGQRGTEQERLKARIPPVRGLGQHKGSKESWNKGP